MARPAKPARQTATRPEPNGRAYSVGVAAGPRHEVEVSPDFDRLRASGVRHARGGAGGGRVQAISRGAAGWGRGAAGSAEGMSRHPAPARAAPRMTSSAKRTSAVVGPSRDLGAVDHGVDDQLRGEV